MTYNRGQQPPQKQKVCPCCGQVIRSKEKLPPKKTIPIECPPGYRDVGGKCLSIKQVGMQPVDVDEVSPINSSKPLPEFGPTHGGWSDEQQALAGSGKPGDPTLPGKKRPRPELSPHPGYGDFIEHEKWLNDPNRKPGDQWRPGSDKFKPVPGMPGEDYQRQEPKPFPVKPGLPDNPKRHIEPWFNYPGGYEAWKNKQQPGEGYQRPRPGIARKTYPLPYPKKYRR